MCDKFMYLCHYGISICVPQKVLKNRVTHSLGVKNALKQKHRYHRIHKQQRTETSLENFKAASEAVNRVASDEMARYESSLLFEPDVRKFYGYVNRKLRSGHSHGVILENNAPDDDINY